MMQVLPYLIIIGLLILVQIVSWIVFYRLIRDLADKIALPIYDHQSRRVIYQRPEKSEDAGDANLPKNSEEPYLVDTEELPVDQAYNAVAGREVER